MPLSAASLRTEGASGMSAPAAAAAAGGARGGFGAALSAAGAAGWPAAARPCGGAPAPSLIWPSSAPTATVSPSLAAISAEHAGGRRRHLDRHLVGLELDQRLVDRDRIARLLEPLADGRLGHRFAERGHADFSHDSPSSSARLVRHRVMAGARRGRP